MKILMVCLGNICRSPLAHGIMEHLVQKAQLDWQIDSAGTGDWHIGEAPDKRSIKTAKKNGIDISQQKARQIAVADLHHFDYIFAMDEQNLVNIRKISMDASLYQKIQLLDTQEVQDPYFDDALFEPVYTQIYRACQQQILNIQSAFNL